MPCRIVRRFFHVALLAAIALTLACHHEGGDAPNDKTTLSFDWLDLNADPCADFERFACGNFHPRFDGDHGSGSTFFDLQVARLQTLYTVVVRNPGTLLDTRASALVKDWYGRCRSNFDRGEQGALGEVLDEVHTGTPAELAQTIVAAARDGTDVLFGTTLLVGSDGKWQLAIVPGGLGLSAERFRDPAGGAIRDAYRAHIDKLSKLVGRSVDSDAVSRIEAALGTASATDEERSEPLALYQTVDRGALPTLLRGFDWDAFFAAAAPSARIDRVTVAAPAYFGALAQVLQTASPEALAAYAKWRLIERFAHTQGQAARSEEYAFHARALAGATGNPNDDSSSYCFGDVYDSLPYAMGEVYLQQTDTHVASLDAARALAIVSDVRRGLESRVREAPWLDAETRAAALDKLAHLEEHVGFDPAAGPDVYGGLKLPGGKSHLASVRALSRYLADGQLGAVGKVVDRAKAWPLPPADVNAAYLASYNLIDVPTGILGGPFFKRDANAAANYGAMGAIVGHELTHALDDHGRAFGPTGALGNWWSEAADAAFRDQAQCLVDEYDRFEPVPGQHIDGLLTLGENMADLGGVLVAYRALEASGEVVPEWHGLSRDQQFFLAYAQSHCEVPDKARLPDQLRTDPHSPGRYRVNGALANVPEFARAYSCVPGRPMAPVQACQIW